MGEHPILTPCGHLFGHACLATWLPHNTCPLCRKPLLHGSPNANGQLLIQQPDAQLLRDLEAAFEFAETIALASADQTPGLTGAWVTTTTTEPVWDEASIRADIEERAPTLGMRYSNRGWLDEERRRGRRRGEMVLYEQLRAEGVELPALETSDPVTAAQGLDPWQGRALFEYLREQRAFRYPRLQRYFNRGRSESESCRMRKFGRG